MIRSIGSIRSRGSFNAAAVACWLAAVASSTAFGQTLTMYDWSGATSTACATGVLPCGTAR